MKKIDIEQGSFEWHQLRHGKVTGTTLGSALGTPKVQQTLTYKLISERMTEPQIDEINSKAVARGKEVEPLARKAIEKHLEIALLETGMLIDDEYDNFAISPDAIYEEEGKVIGGVEIKCPDSKKHIEYLIKDELPKEYRAQVMAPFLMSDDIQWWYFGSYDDRNYEEPLFLKKIYRKDFPEIDSNRTELKDFLAQVDIKHAALTF